MDFKIAALDHVQLAMPPGREAEAERFYCDVLGFNRIPKPAALAKRGGFWFEQGPVKIHLGLDAEFRPVAKAHPALMVTGFDALCAHLKTAGVAIRPDDALPGVRRCYIEDPFGNSIEIMEC